MRVNSSSIFRPAVIYRQDRKQAEQSHLSSSKEEDYNPTIQSGKSSDCQNKNELPDYRKSVTILLNPSKNFQPTHTNNPHSIKGFRMVRRIKKTKKKNSSDYRKNICGYITKKVMREFVSWNYYQKVRDLCELHCCDYLQAKNYYSSKVERVTGPSHIPELLIPENINQFSLKNVFSEFFKWFLNERYARYLMLEGKMSDRKAYIDYKNNTLAPLIDFKRQQAGKKQQEWSLALKKLRENQRKQEKMCSIQIPIAIKPTLVKCEQQ